MTYLQLSTDTAPTAEAHLPDTSPLPRARLSPSASSAALIAALDREHSLIDATLTTLTDHMHAIAHLARNAERADTTLARALARGAEGLSRG